MRLLLPHQLMGATTIDIAAGTFVDVAGNSNTAASQFNWTYEEEILNIDLKEQSISFAFYPNPAKDIIYIKASNIKEVEGTGNVQSIWEKSSQFSYRRWTSRFDGIIGRNLFNKIKE